MVYNFFAPLIRISAVVTYSCIVIHHRTVEIHQEKVCCYCIGQSRTVIALILVIPVFHSVVVCVGKRNFIYALIHLYIFVCICSYGCYVVLHSKIYVRCSHTAFCFGYKTFYNNFFPFSGKSSSCTKFRKCKCICSVVECLYFCVKLFFGGFSEYFIVIVHSEINFVYYFKQIYFKLHSREQRAVYFNFQKAVV